MIALFIRLQIYGICIVPELPMTMAGCTACPEKSKEMKKTRQYNETLATKV